MSISINPSLRIPLADGVELAAILFRASVDAAPGPVVLTVAPYTADSYYPRGAWFAGQGLTFIAVDARGRGNSGGIFSQMRQEMNDGFDIVEWIAAQPFCDGRVAMWGGSYGGHAQWATASRNPPHLWTIVPTASAHPGIDVPARNGVSNQYELQWSVYVAGATLQSNWFYDLVFWRGLWADRYRRGASFRSLTEELGGDWPSLNTWIDLMEADDFSDYAPSDAQLAALDMPILTITGCYDGDQPGALAYYKRHLAVAPSEVAAKHFLVIGPWDHAGTRTPTPSVGGVSFGPASLVDMNQLHLDWYRWTLGEGSRPALLEKRVAYYVMGAERWRYADTLEAATGRAVDYRLDSTGQADQVFASGSLTPGHVATGRPDRYVYDPRNVELAASDLEVDSYDPADQRYVFAREGRQLIYHSAPFDRPTEITGFFRLTVWLSVDTPDTDFDTRVYEVTDNGQSILLSTDVLRARHRSGRDRPELIPGPEPLRYVFENFMFVSREIARGSRLRLTIGPNDSIHAQKNFNGGGAVSDEGFAEARVATVHLLHDADHPSALTVPFGVQAPQ